MLQNKYAIRIILAVFLMIVAVGLIFVYRQTVPEEVTESVKSITSSGGGSSAPLGSPRSVGMNISSGDEGELDQSDSQNPDFNDGSALRESDSGEGVSNREEFDQQIELTITQPARYDVFEIGNTVRVSLSSPSLRQVQVFVKESPAVCEGDSKCLSQFLGFRRSYSVGAQSLNRGYVDISTDTFEPGQYIVEIVDGNTVIGESEEFAVVSETNSLELVVPFENQELSGDGELLRWQASPDIFYVDIFIEGEQRIQIASNKRNDSFFAWDYRSLTGQDIASGDYVLVVEDRFSGQRLDSVPFQVSKN